MPAYLFLATLPCDVLSALLAFSDRVVYPAYLSTPRPFELSPLRDQQLAGVLMWVCVSFVYLIPAVIIALQILWPDRSQAVGQVQPPRGKAAHVAF
jgi:cytochrome c oxidase assembly factor CtaG